MPRIGLGIGIGIGSRGGAGWTPQNIDFHCVGRSGLSLNNSLGDDGEILLPYLSLPTGDEFLKITDNGALDIGANDKFTFYQWIKGEDATGGVFRYFGGKLVSGNRVGRYGFYCDTNNKFACQSHPSGGLKIITSEVLITDNSPHLLIMEIDQTALLMRFYIDNVQIGADTEFTGTFSVMPDAFDFYINCGNNSTGSTTANIAKASYSDAGILYRILSPIEKTTLFNRGTITGQKAHWTMGGVGQYTTDEPDVSGNGYHLSPTNIAFTDYLFSSFGSRHCIDVGYTHYMSGYKNGDLYIPYSDAGVELAFTAIPEGSEKKLNHNGDTVNHNLCNSLLYLPFSTWDRSDVTIYSDFARAADTYYDSTSDVTKRYWHISELNNLKLNAWSNIDHKGHNFVLIDDHSYKERKTLKELLSFTENQSGSIYSRIISEYCNDYVYAGIYENDNIYWKYDTQNIIGVKGAKLLKKDGTTVYLSLDEGATWPYSKTIIGLEVIQFSYIFDNGNILFADYKKVYLSTDNLATVNEITPTNIDGDPYIPAAKDNYQEVIPDTYINIGGVEIKVWGNYSTTAGIENVTMNVWYTVDNGATVKCAFSLGTTLAPLTFRHIHSVNYYVDGNYWILSTGDSHTPAEENHWIKGEYNFATDIWTWTLLHSGYDYKSAGIAFYDGDVIWSADRTDNPAHRGIKICSIADVGTPANHVMKLKTDTPCMDLLLDSDGFLIASKEGASGRYVNGIITSNDFGATIKMNMLYGLPSAYYLTIRKDKTLNGWFLNHIFLTTETASTQQAGGVFWVKIK